MSWFTVAQTQTEEQLIPTHARNIQLGKEAFNLQCVKCHQLGEQRIGPSLASITDKKSVGWLIQFIRNSGDVIANGDPYAVHLFRNYNHMAMPNYHELGDSTIMNILAYLQDASLMKNHSYTKDSVNYYDEDLLSKTYERYTQKQETEIDYFKNTSAEALPNDLPSIQEGEELFNGLCRSCHIFDKRKTGPALASVTDRLPLPWLVDFIMNPKKVLKSGDDYANFMASKYPLVMPEFETQLSKKDVRKILGYIRYETGANTHVAGVNANKILETSSTQAQEKMPVPFDSKEKEKPAVINPLLKSFIIFITVLFIGIILGMIIKVFKTAYKQ